MALTVGENSYIDLSYANDYHSQRQSSEWIADSLTDTAKEAAIIKATQFLDVSFNYVGLYKKGNQLQWPRDYAYSSYYENETYIGFYDLYYYNYIDENIPVDDNDIPIRLKEATAELALYALSNEIRPILPRNGRVTKEKVGPVEISYAFGAGGQSSFNHVINIIRPLLQSYGGATRR